VSKRFLIEYAAAVLLFFPIAGSAQASGCGWLGGILGVCKAIDDANDRLDSMTKVVDANAKAAIRAVPGERYNQLIDDRNSGDKEKVAQARAFLTRLAHLDPEAQYQVSLRFSFDTKKPFNYDVFAEAEPSLDIVKSRAATRGINLLPANRTIFAPHTKEQPKADISKTLDKAVNPYMFGATQPVGCGGGIMGGGCLPQIPPAGFGLIPQLRKQFLDGAVDAVMATVTEKPDEIVDGVREFDWDPLSERPFLIIMIDQATYDGQSDFDIVAKITEKTHPDQLLYQRPPVHFIKKDFNPELDTPVKDNRDEIIYWAFKDMTAQFSVDSQRVKQIVDLKQALIDWDNKQKPH
jgi:hypothetical protein